MKTRTKIAAATVAATVGAGAAVALTASGAGAAESNLITVCNQLTDPATLVDFSADVPDATHSLAAGPGQCTGPAPLPAGMRVVVGINTGWGGFSTSSDVPGNMIIYIKSPDGSTNGMYAEAHVF
ncbi:MAG TPA: hypothetical protein VF109_11905 [Mycobacteriales bacterium]